MFDRLNFLWPEMILFVTTCLVMVLGLSRAVKVRNWTAIVAGLGLAAAGAVAWYVTPSGEDAVTGGAGQGLLPNMPRYIKLIAAVVGLVLLLLQAGTVDRVEESRIASGKRVYDPLRANRAEYYAFFLFSLTGLMLTASADTLIWLFLALELTSLPTYIMVAISSARNRSREAGVKYFFLGALGAAIFLYGFALIYGGTGSMRLNEIASVFRAEGINAIAMTGILLALIGFAFKIAAVPMHFYTADVYEGAAPQVSGFLAFVPKTAGFVAILLLCGTLSWRFATPVGPGGFTQFIAGGVTKASAFGSQLPEPVRVLLWMLAVVTMTVGNVLAVLQTSVKRMLAYSSIAHSGYMLVGVVVGPGEGTFTTSGIAAVMFYLFSYGIMNAGLFGALAALERKAGSDGEPVEIDHVDDLRGLCAAHPVLGWTFVVCALSLLGLPPLVGFFAKLPLFTSGIHAGQYVLVVILGINSAIAAYYYLRLAFFPFLEKADEFVEAPAKSPFRTRIVGAAVASLFVIVLSVSANHLTRHATVAGRVDASGTLPPMLMHTLEVRTPETPSHEAPTPAVHETGAMISPQGSAERQSEHAGV